MVKFSTTMSQMGNNTDTAGAPRPVEIPDDLHSALNSAAAAVVAKLER